MKISFFIAGLLSGAACALIWWPEKIEPRKSAGGHPGSSRLASQRPSIKHLLSDHRNASSRQQKYQARQAFGILSTGQIQEALELVHEEGESYQWNPEARSLIVHWANRDPESALAWSWENLRNSNRWEIATREIFETWIANGDPAVIPYLNGIQKIDYSPNVEEVEDDPPMSLSRGQMMKITEWLFFYNENLALAAFGSGIKMGWTSPPPPRFYDRLESPAEVEAALLRWDGLKDSSMIQHHIKARGAELGMDFSRQSEETNETVARTSWSKSPGSFWGGARVDLTQALGRAAALEPKARHDAYLVLYDSWTLANPDQKPDFDAFPSEAREVWKDLAGLGPVADDHRISYLHKE